jgi:hypothetical protein
MIEAIEGLLATIFLIPGFICIFIPYKLVAVKIRMNNFELTIFSLIVSITIFFLSISSYQLIIENLDFSSLTTSQLFSNISFCIIFLGYFFLFLILGIYSISNNNIIQKFFQTIRKKITGNDMIVTTEKYVWDIALKNHKGYVIIQTKDNEFFLGIVDWYTLDSKENQILLRNPEKLDIEKHKSIPIDDYMWYDIDRILFLDNDIKRVYLIPKQNKNIENKG